jgi:hypothetical protein
MASQLDPSHTTRVKLGRASQLIGRIIASGEWDFERLAQGLNLPATKLEGYASGEQTMPLDHQARLALFVISRIPAFMREGNQLRHQVGAAIAFESGVTVTHESKA